MRNPDTVAKELNFTLNEGVGCTSDGTYHVVLDHVYTEKGKKAYEAPKAVQFGDVITVNLSAWRDADLASLPRMATP